MNLFVCIFLDAFQKLLHTVENNTYNLFATAYSNKIPLKDIREPLQSLFLDLRAYLDNKEVDIRNTCERFFDELFPLVFHNILLNPSTVTELDDSYRECLMESRRQIYPRPFGEIPGILANKLSRSMSVQRLFLESLKLAETTVNSSDFTNFGANCLDSVTRLSFCSHCEGRVDIKPCGRNYCRVIRDCVSSVTDLSLQWRDFVDALDMLVSAMNGGYDFEEHLLAVHQEISDAIMHAMQNTPKFYNQVILYG